jgi:hypothetical protein
MARMNQSSPITALAYAIRPRAQWNEVFGTDNLENLSIRVTGVVFSGASADRTRDGRLGFTNERD